MKRGGDGLFVSSKVGPAIPALTEFAQGGAREGEAAAKEGNQELIAALRQKFERAVKTSEDTIALPVRRKGAVAGRILPFTSIYEIGEPGSSVYIIDGMSQDGFLTLIDVAALMQGDHERLYQQDLGTYERDESGAMKHIYLTLAGKGIQIDRLFFDQGRLASMVEQSILCAVREDR